MRAFRRAFRIISVILIVIILAVLGYNIALRYLYPSKYNELIQKYSEQFEVDRSLVYAVIKCESNFDENATSRANAAGLMQLTEETFSDVGKMLGDDKIIYDEHKLDAEISIKYGTRYLKYLFEQFDGDKIAVIAAYNAGLGNVRKWIGSADRLQKQDIRFKETANYVDRVLKAQEIYNKLYS